MESNHVLPAINVVIGIYGLTWLLVRSSSRWDEYPREVRLQLAMTLALYFALITTSAEMIAIENPLFYSSVLIFIVKVFSLYALWATRTTKFRTGTRRGDGNPGFDQDLDVPDAR